MSISTRFYALAASALAASLAAAAPAQAQGVFDPGVLTVTLGAGAVEQSENARAGRSTHRRSPAETMAYAKLTCSRYPSYYARFGSGDARVRKLRGLCAQLGYSAR